MFRLPENREVVLTIHAIDQASNRLLNLWKKTREEGEGLATWLDRRAYDATSRGRRTNKHLAHRDIRFGFVEDAEDPSCIRITTVMRDESEDHRIGYKQRQKAWKKRKKQKRKVAAKHRL